MECTACTAVREAGYRLRDFLTRHKLWRGMEL